MIRKSVVLFIVLIAVQSIKAEIKYSSKNYSNTLLLNNDPYEKICFVFVGKPKKEVLKPLLEAVMKKYKLNITEENIMKAASTVLTLRKKSSGGVTEMKILKHMYEQGTSNSTFANQAALSSVIIEKIK